MNMFISPLKSTLTALSLFAFCTLLLPLLVFANTDPKTKYTAPEYVKFYGIEQCQPIVAAYVEWHGKALAIGNSLDKDEHEWLSGDYYRLHQTGSVFSREVKLDEKHSLVIEPELRISKFIELSVVCREDEHSSALVGDMAVKVELDTGVTKLLYYSFSPKLKAIWGEEPLLSDPGTIARYFKEYEPFPNDLVSRISQGRINAVEDLKRMQGIKPNNLVFNDDDVEFWFDWPSNTLVKTTERVEVKYTASGETTQDTVSEHYYERMISSTKDGVRLSELADNRNYRFKSTSKEEWSLPDWSRASECIAEAGRLEFCWLIMPASIANHYEYSTLGQRRALPVDTLFMDEVEQWIDERLEGMEDLDSYRAAMRALLEEKKADNSELVFDSRVYFTLSAAHGKIMKAGDVYAPFLEFVIPRIRYAKPPRPFTQHPPREARYMGRVPCNPSDDTLQCAKIEIRNKVLDSDKPVYPEEVIKNDLQIDFILEPHTLLVHEAHYRFLGEASLGSDSDTVGKTSEIEISIINSFEPQ